MTISDSLREFKVDSHAYQIDKKTYNPSNFSFPFIAYVSTRGGIFILVHNIINGHVIVSDEKNKNQLILESEFSKLWGGVLLSATLRKESGEVNFLQNRTRSLIQKAALPIFLLTFFSMLVSIFSLHAFNWSVFLLCTIKLTGTTVGVLLLIHNLDANNSFIKNICNSHGRIGCNTILHLKGANITSWLSWSEMGFYYFSGSFLLVLIFPVLAPGLAWINIITLPYTVYSLSYQYKVKQWCVLCCTVQFLLIMEFVVFNHSFSLLKLDFSSRLSELGVAILCFLIPVSIWTLLKPVLSNALMLKTIDRQFKRFKYDNELFNHVLTHQKRYLIEEELVPIILGNHEANTTLTIISDPFCRPCAKAHHLISEWLEQRENLRIELLFYTNDDRNDFHTKIARHIIALSLSEDKSLIIQALNDWYNPNRKDQETWIAKYPVMINSVTLAASAKQKVWREMANITFTPTVLVNGYKLPEPYRLEDLKYLIN